MSTAPVLIVGAGMASYSLAREFRKLDKDSALVIVTGDAGHAYAKPMLSNAFALGKDARQLVSQEAAQMAAQLGAQVLPSRAVEAIDLQARSVRTAQGDIAYRSLVLATGAAPVRLQLDGDAADEVLSVNNIDDYARLRSRLALTGAPARVAIIGAGLIGCEFADDLLAAGHHVTLIDPAPRLLAALAAPSLSEGLRQAWQGRAVQLHLGTVAQRVERSGAGLRVSLANGAELDADIVLSAVGLRANVALAQAAGLRTERGIVVDRHGRTSAPDVFALGDCAQYDTASGSAVLPYVAPMLAAARAIAATLAGQPAAIDIKADPVVVKTPSYRMALLPPPAGIEGAWHDQHDGERTVARFFDRAGVLRGFGLSHPTPTLRQSLLSEMQQVAAAA
ncbi:NAD(P)/FAD-dependent oxidoreductase [Pseudoduganella sp. GCM10020061]|uniref:NAD(P)/FAD-dependent oxidoreductase n=1 Tax=Pseudoduganella sp. GCM10020061 TaxID=3317345 RepID=UPI00362E87F2